MVDQQFLLNDEQMQFFIRNGYITLKTRRPPDFHAEIYRQTETVFDKEGNPGNNLLPRIPLVQRIFDDPYVTGALAGIFGPNYYMHPHRHCHYNPPGSKGQNMHKDSWTRRRHRTRWGMAFYYPQDTPEDLGPTGVIPESQYYNERPNGAGKGEMPLCGEAGAVTIVHYDLWHRAMPNRSDKKRYMMKFLITRMEEPEEASWRSAGAEWRPTDDEQDIMWSHVWNWHAGGENKGAKSESGRVSELISALGDASESASFSAAYALGEIGEPAVASLIDALRDGPDTVRQRASYALSEIGAPATPALTDLLGDENEEVCAVAADTLGDIGPTAREAIPALTGVLKSESPAVRRNATEALGIVGQLSGSAVPALAGRLQDTDEWTRRNASLALCRIGAYAQEAVPALKSALANENRYVRANAAHALHRIGAPEAQEALFRFLIASRWCPSTTPDSTF